MGSEELDLGVFFAWGEMDSVHQMLANAIVGFLRHEVGLHPVMPLPPDVDVVPYVVRDNLVEVSDDAVAGEDEHHRRVVDRLWGCHLAKEVPGCVNKTYRLV